MSAIPTEPDPPPPPPPPEWKRPPPHVRYLSESHYAQPPREVRELLATQPAPSLVLHAGSRTLVRLYEQPLIPQSQISRPTLALAGRRFDPQNRTPVEAPLYTHLVITRLDDPKVRIEVVPPVGALLGTVHFSATGTTLLAELAYTDRVAVGMVDVDSGTLTELPLEHLSGFWGTPCSWLHDEALLCRTAEFEGPPPPTEIRPHSQELLDGAMATFTYSNLLEDNADDALLTHYGSVSMLYVRLEEHEVAGTRRLETSGLIDRFAVSPNGEYLLTEGFEPPYSRIVPLERFPRTLQVVRLEDEEPLLEVRDHSGDSVSTSVPWGPRRAQWDPARPARLVYLERSLRSTGVTQDALLERLPPFDQSRTLADHLLRVRDCGFSTAGTLWVSDVGQTARTWRSYVVTDDKTLLATGTEAATLGDPDRALRVHGDRGAVLEVERQLFFSREESRKNDTISRLRAWHMDAKTSRALWRSKETEQASVIAMLDLESRNYLVRSETARIPPYYLESKKGYRRAVTRPQSPIDALEGIQRQLIVYRRADGVLLSGMLYLPAGYRPGKRIPTVFWIYPRDYQNPEQASRVTEHPNGYFEIRGPSRFSVLAAGYALLDGPSMPIVGKVTSGRDDFLPQLIDSAQAAIDYLVNMGISQRDQVAVMGRSYGAFAVANLMAHSELFSTGIALSGAYNRTLTPFGFQRETQTFWQNTEAYVNLSPFFFADQVEGSLLLLHGEQDDNPGTPVFQSERFYEALAGNGVSSRFVSFPFEGHQFRGRASVMHATAEIIAWLDRHFRPSRSEGRGGQAATDGAAPEGTVKGNEGGARSAESGDEGPPSPWRLPRD